MNVMYEALHDLKLWRKTKHDRPMFEILDKSAPHHITYETTLPLDPMAGFTSVWNVFDVDAFVTSQTSEYRRQYRATKVLNELGWSGDKKAKGKAMLIYGDKMERAERRRDDEDWST